MEVRDVLNQLRDKIAIIQKNVKEVDNRQHELKLNILGSIHKQK
jgi:hypothetical protein